MLVELAVVCGSCLLIVCSILLFRQTFFLRYGIPAPIPIPFLGNVHLIVKKGIYAADDFLRKKYGNIFGYYMFNTPNLGVADANMIHEICITQNDNFPNRATAFYMGEFVERSVSITKGEHWKFTRAVLNPLFSEESVQQFLPQINQCVDKLMENIEERRGTPVEINSLMSAYILDSLLLCGFGLDLDSLHFPDHSFVRCAKEACSIRPNYVKQVMSALLPRFEAVFKDNKILKLSAIHTFTQIVNGILAERESTKPSTTDFLQMMIDTQTDEPKHSYKGQLRGLTNDEVLRNALTLILAGHGTASTAITWCVFCLADNRNCQQELRNEVERELGEKQLTFADLQRMEYLDMFFSETIRKYPPPTRFTRNTSQNSVVCGRHLEKGLDLFIPVYTIHHDPEKWADPETFRPERFSAENRDTIRAEDYVPFGLGPRGCIGKHLGTLMCKAALVEMVRKYRLTIAEKTEMPPPISGGLLIKPSKDIYLHMEPISQQNRDNSTPTLTHRNISV